jgi:hypothetical protein
MRSYQQEIIIGCTDTCFIQKIYAPSSSLLQGKHLPFSPSPLRLNIFCLFVILCCNAIIEDTVTLKCRTTIKVLFHYFNLCLNVQGSVVELVIKLIIWLAIIYISWLTTNDCKYIYLSFEKFSVLVNGGVQHMLCCDFCYVCLLSCVTNVANFSGLSILGCPCEVHICVKLNFIK